MSSLLHADNPSVTALVSSPVVPVGGTAQITVMLPSPMAFTHGRFTIDVDPAVFGNISAVQVFSASGDQQGVAKIQARHADVQFGANSGGIGRLPNLPVAEITVPVLATAVKGTTGAVTVQSSSIWYEVSGKRYTLSFKSPGVSIGAGISIQSVAPGAGTIPAGTLVTISGQGFTNSTKLQLAGVSWSNLQFVNSSSLTITLAGPTDLAGKLFQLTDAGGASTLYYSDLTPVSIHDDFGNSGYWPILPTAKYVATHSEYGGYLWFENDTANPIDVVLSPYRNFACTPCATGPQPPDKKITIVGGSIYMSYYDPAPFGYSPATGVSFTASAPLRVLSGRPPQTDPLSELTPTVLSPGASGYCYPHSSGPVDFQIGDPAPPAMHWFLSSTPQAFVGDISIGTDDGNPWLQAIQLPGSANGLSVSIDPASLALGLHTGVVMAGVAPPSYDQGFECSTFSINVHAPGAIAVQASSFVGFDPSSPLPVQFTVTSHPPVPLTVSSSDSWLVVSPSSATTPATLTARMAPSTFPPYRNGTLTFRGPNNSVVVPAYVSFGVPFLNGDQSVAFAARVGPTGVLISQFLWATTFLDLTVETDSGGNWLSVVESAVYDHDTVTWVFTVHANPSGLAAGVYHGAVNITPTNDPHSSAHLPVTLSVWSEPTPPPMASPASLELSLNPQNSLLSVSTGTVPLPFTATYQIDDGASFYREVMTSGMTPASFQVLAYASYPGTYHGSVTITAPSGSANSVIVPVTVTAPSTPVASPIGPQISAIVNAGSLQPGSIAPGEIVSIFGDLVSVGTAGLNVGSDGKVNRQLYGNQVLFNGVAAPLTYMSGGQINAVVPYEIAGSQAVNVQIKAGGVPSASWSVPVAASVPGLFTQNGTGQNNAAILNQDNSLNTSQNSALRGSIVQMFLTGEGMTNPPGITGEVTGSNLKNPTQPITVQIGGSDAKVISATTAPGAVAGLFQINAVVPPGSPAGSVPVVVRIGTASSQSAATISVR